MNNRMDILNDDKVTTEDDGRLIPTARVYKDSILGSKPWRCDLYFAPTSLGHFGNDPNHTMLGWIYGWGTQEDLLEAMGSMKDDIWIVRGVDR